MHQIVYLSSAVQKFTEEELKQILTRSRTNNERVGLTGILLYHDGNIIQVLEGPADRVTSTFKKISRDFRHRGIITLIDRKAAARVFPDWSMAFRAIASSEFTQLQGYLYPSNAHKMLEGEQTDSSEVISLLKSFANFNLPK